MGFSPRILLPLGYMAALLLLSSIPGDSESDDLVSEVFMWVAPQVQNLLHIPVYGGLCFSWYWALEKMGSASNTRLVLAIALSVAWGFLDESWQRHIPGRSGSLTDLALNTLGVALAALYIRRRNSRTAAD